MLDIGDNPMNMYKDLQDIIADFYVVFDDIMTSILDSEENDCTMRIALELEDLKEELEEMEFRIEATFRDYEWSDRLNHYYSEMERKEIGRGEC